MGKIFYVMGKSASGKDTIYKKLLERLPQLQTVTLYTTRPRREGETEGVEYHFVTDVEMKKMETRGAVVEKRTYETVYGPWSYATVDDGQIDLKHSDYLMIGTLESYRSVREYFGAGFLIPIYIEVEDGERLMRAIRRERQQPEPKYEELCRRFLADARDFSQENLAKCQIGQRFQNSDLEVCLEEICTLLTSNIL